MYDNHEMGEGGKENLQIHTVWFIRDTFIRDIWRISEILGDIPYGHLKIKGHNCPHLQESLPYGWLGEQGIFTQHCE